MWIQNSSRGRRVRRNGKKLKDSMTTYNINKTGLTPIYTKRLVLEDGRTTVPLLNVDLEANLDDHDIDSKEEDSNIPIDK